MAQLYFVYGSMAAGKSLKLLSVNNNYTEQGMPCLLLKPDIDTRDIGVISSRVGIKEPCELFSCSDNLYEKYLESALKTSCVLIDEAQFLTKQQVIQLTKFVDIHNIPVMCFGLKTDFKGELFEGSAALLSWADKLEELKAVCYCGRKATHTAKSDRFGNPVKEGEVVEIGGDDKYISFCRKHYFEFNK
ncbi:thymidine kinase [Proteus phage PM2]|uniref:Thymidine kinase n=2 Tax=Bragavirus TaxID=2948639 RepID=A0A0G2SS57_9CAUD|nr:thymidine kinase [Proteus phage vB_PmiM_Pm5461]YP_010091964.1 thymidine kinase [Proteus phage PM2]AKA61953.1 thymidine kinase [Proteus phage vB_PmiM_Pm5461]ASZ76356.1 thymidine kinase [Proteus phage PM2]